MKKILLLLGVLASGLYSVSFILLFGGALIYSIFSGDYGFFQGFFSTLIDNGFVGYLVILQTTVVPFLSGWLAVFLYKKYKKLKFSN